MDSPISILCGGLFRRFSWGLSVELLCLGCHCTVLEVFLGSECCVAMFGFTALF